MRPKRSNTQQTNEQINGARQAGPTRTIGGNRGWALTITTRGSSRNGYTKGIAKPALRQPLGGALHPGATNGHQSASSKLSDTLVSLESRVALREHVLPEWSKKFKVHHPVQDNEAKSMKVAVIVVVTRSAR
jgi:hypothetical protein